MIMEDNTISNFQGGKSSRIVNCVLALKSYSEWKQAGSHGTWRSGGTVKPSTPNKNLVRKNSDPFTSPLSRMNGRSQDTDNNKMVGDQPFLLRYIHFLPEGFLTFSARNLTILTKACNFLNYMIKMESKLF